MQQQHQVEESPVPVKERAAIVGEKTLSDTLGGLLSKGVLEQDTSELIQWHVETLRGLLQQIQARRSSISSGSGSFMNSNNAEQRTAVAAAQYEPNSPGTVVDEIVEVLPLPVHTHHNHHVDTTTPSTTLPPLTETVEKQLLQFIQSIASMYRNNPFHNFAHASRVTASLQKLFQSAAAATTSTTTTTTTNHLPLVDPATQCACMVAALIHDVDHAGVPNARLVQEESPLAATYQNKSVAEQNSVDLAWNLLLQPQFDDLRQVIYTNEQELQHFRQVIVNAVMATDIMDKDLKELRNARWNKAFVEDDDDDDDDQGCVHTSTNRRATSIIEHLIQASDVGHTMDHWDAFCMWNRRLFEEMSDAYDEGRAEQNPADSWYKGEIGFFDFYIIPLVKKLQASGVVAGDELLQNAQKNRQLWEEQGQTIVAEMVLNRMSQKCSLTMNVSRPAAA